MLTIKFDGQDVSTQQSRYEFVTSSHQFDGLKDLTVSFYKPVNCFYIHITKQEISKRLSVQYWNGVEWKEINHKDLTFGLSRSGFVSWDRNLSGEKDQSGEFTYKLQMTELNGSDLVTPVSVDFKGVNLVFSDDWDLIEEYPSIMQHLPEGQETFIRFHATARDEILTDFKTAGIVVESGNKRKQIDQWDLLDKDEVREASKFSALSKIFSWLSDTSGDRYDQLAKEYQAEAGSSLSPLISLDRDDDGLKDNNESVQTEVMIIGRM